MAGNISALNVIQNAGYQERYFQKFLIDKFSKLPKTFRKVVNDRYISTFQNNGIKHANLMLLDVAEATEGANGLMASSDYELCEYAKKCVKQGASIAMRFKSLDMALYYLREHAKNKGIEPPNEKISKAGQYARLLCEKFWRRSIRKGIARRVEGFAISLGLVHRKKCIYASDETVKRRNEQQLRNFRILDNTIAINEIGQEYKLSELCALGVSNLEIRRMELMTRIDGFDKLAQMLGHGADFYTLTCPSRFHAIGYNGKPNKKYSGETPKEAQAHLSKTWAKVRAYLAKHGVKVYGFRVAEPHHDGTPHWHMILFYEKQNKQLIRDAMHSYFLAVDGHEFGALKRRCTVKDIDYSKGNAVGYLAKYISKNINAEGMHGAVDYEGADLDSSVQRVGAWAAVWGIRQFQQIGGAPVGVWREARRLGAVTVTDTLTEIIAAADAGDWAEYTNLQGGVFVSRRDLKVKIQMEFIEDGLTLYDGYGLNRVYGLLSAESGEIIKTHLHEWVLKRALAPAWSSVNNCNQIINLEGGGKENILHTVRRFPQILENYPTDTGIKENEKITDFDRRVFYGT